MVDENGFVWIVDRDGGLHLKWFLEDLDYLHLPQCKAPTPAKSLESPLAYLKQIKFIDGYRLFKVMKWMFKIKFLYCLFHAL